MTPYEFANSDGIKTQFMETGHMQVWVFDGKNVDQYVDAARVVASEFGWEPKDLAMCMDDSTLHVSLQQQHRDERSERHGKAMANWGGW